MIRVILLVFLAFFTACARPAPAPVASQAACPETLPDVDRLACWISAGPDAAPGARKPSVLLRDSDGSTIIGPRPSQ